MKIAKRLLSVLLILLMIFTLTQHTFAAECRCDSLPLECVIIVSSYDDLDAYKKYLETEDLPAGFIMPDELEPIGTFNSWVPMSGLHERVIYYYHSVYMPEDDVTLWLEIRHGRFIDWEERNHPELDLSSVGDDMRTLRDTVDPAAYERSIIRRGDLIFS